MRLAPWLMLVAACGQSREPFGGEDAGVVRDAAGEASADASEDAQQPVDAGRDAGVEAGDASGPGLFDACSAEAPCPSSFSTPGIGSVVAACWGDHTPTAHVDMFERCTFSCHDPSAPQQLDIEARAVCEQRGGECWPWQAGGIPICMPRP